MRVHGHGTFLVVCLGTKRLLPALGVMVAETRLDRPVFGALWFAGSTLFLGFLAGQFAQGWLVS